MASALAHRSFSTVNTSKTAAIGVIETEIEGGFRLISTHQLFMGWWLYQTAKITKRQLRVYFAVHEMHERRTASDKANTLKGPQKRRQRPVYGVEEVARLVGGRGDDKALDELRSDVKRLGKIGLVKVGEHIINFARCIDDLQVEDKAGFQAMFAAIPNQQRNVPVPRRMLRELAAGFKSSVMAVILALLIRSVFWHKKAATYRVDGRTKGSWIAATFGISRRAVTDARAQLIELGWIKPLHANQRALNTWGSYDQIDTAWTRKPANDGGAGEGSEFASPSSEITHEFASPLLNRSLSSPLEKQIKTRNSADPEPTGVSRNGREEKKQVDRGSRPSIRDVQPQHLHETEDLLELHRQAIEAGLIDSSEASRLDFLAYAERARAHGTRPGALFMWLLRGRQSKFITQADEDAALRRLRELRGREERSRGGKPAAPPPRELSEDERIFLACMRIAAQERLQDPYSAARSLGWTRQKWEEVKDAYDQRRYTRFEEKDVSAFGKIAFDA